MWSMCPQYSPCPAGKQCVPAQCDIRPFGRVQDRPDHQKLQTVASVYCISTSTLRTLSPVSSPSSMTVFTRSTRRFLFIALWLGMMIGVMGTTVASSMLGSSLFRDVKADSPYDAAIGEMVDTGVMEGVSKTQFKPNAVVSRGELALILKRFRDSLEGANAKETAEDEVSSNTPATSSVSSSSSSSSVKSLPYNPSGYIRFATTVFSVNESLGTATVTIVRTGGNQGTVSVDYALIPGTAVAGKDYVDVTGTLTFAAKETSKKLQIQVKDDGLSTPERILTIELKNAKNGAGVGYPSQTMLKILDRFVSNTPTERGTSGAAASSSSPTTPVLHFSTSAYAVNEDGGSINISVLRSGVTATPVDVKYATSNGTASLNDHTPLSGTLSFAANETTKTFTVTIPDDGSVDGNRSVSLTISNPTNGGVIGSPGAATLNIVDNESMSFGSGSLKISKAKYDASEGEGKAVITVLRVGGAKGTATVSYAATGGSASDGADFRSVAGTLTFAPGEAGKTFEVPLIKDSAADAGETVSLTLSNAVGASLGDIITAVLTIHE